MYEFWSVKMKMILKAHDLWHFVHEGFEDSDIEEGEEPVLGRLTLKEKVTRDAKALSLIQNVVSNEIFSRISNVGTSFQNVVLDEIFPRISKQAWDIIG